MRRVLGSNYIKTLMELEHPMNNPSDILGRRKGFMVGGKKKVSVLLHGSNAFSIAWI